MVCRFCGGRYSVNLSPGAVNYYNACARCMAIQHAEARAGLCPCPYKRPQKTEQDYHDVDAAYDFLMEYGRTNGIPY